MSLKETFNMDGFWENTTELGCVLQFLSSSTTDLIGYNGALEEMEKAGKKESGLYEMTREFLLSELERVQSLVLKATELIVPEEEHGDESAFGAGELTYTKEDIEEDEE